jgi:hypothetical protein
MDEIKDIIHSIVKGCGQGGINVSEILAAFVAKTVRPFESFFPFFLMDVY